MTDIRHAVTGLATDRQYLARRALRDGDLATAVLYLVEQLADDMHKLPGPTAPPPDWKP